MTALQTVRRARSIIIGAAVVRALILGIAVTYAVGAILGFVWFATSTLVEGPTLALISLAFGISSVVVLLWRERRALRVQQVALWLEQRIPRLEYALVTRVEQPRSDFAPAMDAIVARENVQRATLEGIRKPLLIAVIALLLASAFQYVSPSGPLMHMYPSGHPSVAIYGHESGGLRSRLDAIEARVTPPAYTSLPAVTLRDPSSINAFVGSAIVVRGNGSPAGIRAAATNSLSVARSGDGWSVSLAMPAQPAALRFTDGGFERVIVLAPQSDELPRVVLSSPVHDTALRTPRLTVQLVANGSDDVGLQQGHFEYLVTSGAGEIFKSRTVNTPAIQFKRDRSATMRATLDLSSLNLAEGDVVSMRAIVQDGNTLSGPGVGTSDTRTIRIIRASEYDSLAIEAAAPPPLDSSAVSQRMLVMMAEKLVKDQPKIARTELVNRSNEIGDLEDRVRRRVGEILSNEETGGEPMQPGDTAPQLEESEPADAGGAVVNKDLHAAYNSLWQAVRALKIADPGTALPPMRSALAALDRARLANRLYLRGTPPRIIVDLNRVRLSGKEKGISNTRTPRTFADSARVRLVSGFDAAIGLIDNDPARAVTQLSLLRVEALTIAPEFAAALADVNDAVRNRRDATLPLLRARRALEGPPQVESALSPWSGGGD